MKTKGWRKLTREIQANSRAWNAGVIDYETFSVRQREAWDAIEAAGARTRVLAALRANLPVAA